MAIKQHRSIEDFIAENDKNFYFANQWFQVATKSLCPLPLPTFTEASNLLFLAPFLHRKIPIPGNDELNENVAIMSQELEESAVTLSNREKLNESTNGSVLVESAAKRSKMGRTISESIETEKEDTRTETIYSSNELPSKEISSTLSENSTVSSPFHDQKNRDPFVGTSNTTPRKRGRPKKTPLNQQLETVKNIDESK